jgi:hypothetical protein
MRSAYVRTSKLLEPGEHGISEEDRLSVLRESAIMVMETAFNMHLTDDQKNKLKKTSNKYFQKRLSEIFKDKRVSLTNVQSCKARLLPN